MALITKPPLAVTIAVPTTVAEPFLIDIAEADTVANALIAAAPFSKNPPLAVTVANPLTLADPLITPLLTISDEYGSCEYAEKPNIYRTTHLEPLGTVTLMPLGNVIGPALIAEYPLGTV
jgi:hypothetical protein